MGGEIFYLLVMVFIVGSCFGYIIGKTSKERNKK